MKKWKLKKGSDIRVRSRHPWVFSNELNESPKGVEAGEPIELVDFKNYFLAYGYGNPHSLIAFRAVSFDSTDDQFFSEKSMIQKLLSAIQKRIHLGFKDSFRMVYSESDLLPGLILDRYVILHNQKKMQIFSYQTLTAGMDLIFKRNSRLLQSLAEKTFELKIFDIDSEHTIILQKNDVNIRKLEGLAPLAPVVETNPLQVDLQNVQIQIPFVLSDLIDIQHKLSFDVNLIEGQKTGFFLDQTHNIRLVLLALKSKLTQNQYTSENPFKIVDLCCYMGQWSAQIGCFLKTLKIPFEVTLVDVSDLALQKAEKNLRYWTDRIHVKKADVLKDLDSMAARQFDLVISDPPAFVKNKKDLESGLHGYMKLNETAFRIAKPQSFVVSCTCSGLVTMDDFKNSIRKSIVRSGHVSPNLIAEGGLGWDHPALVQFKEGQYLKMLLHLT